MSINPFSVTYPQLGHRDSSLSSEGPQRGLPQDLHPVEDGRRSSQTQCLPCPPGVDWSAVSMGARSGIELQQEFIGAPQTDNLAAKVFWGQPRLFQILFVLFFLTKFFCSVTFLGHHCASEACPQILWFFQELVGLELNSFFTPSLCQSNTSPVWWIHTNAQHLDRCSVLGPLVFKCTSPQMQPKSSISNSSAQGTCFPNQTCLELVLLNDEASCCGEETGKVFFGWLLNEAISGVAEQLNNG